MASSRNSFQSTRPIGRVLWEELLTSFLDFTRNCEWTSGIFVPWNQLTVICMTHIECMLIRMKLQVFRLKTMFG